MYQCSKKYLEISFQLVRHTYVFPSSCFLQCNMCSWLCHDYRLSADVWLTDDGWLFLSFYSDLVLCWCVLHAPYLTLLDLVILLIPRRLRGHSRWSLLFPGTYSHTWDSWVFVLFEYNISSRLCHDLFHLPSFLVRVVHCNLFEKNMYLFIEVLIRPIVFAFGSGSNLVIAFNFLKLMQNLFVTSFFFISTRGHWNLFEKNMSLFIEVIRFSIYPCGSGSKVRTFDFPKSMQNLFFHLSYLLVRMVHWIFFE